MAGRMRQMNNLVIKGMQLVDTTEELIVDKSKRDD